MSRAAAPLRTCVGCRRVRPRPELLRLVRGQDGAVRVDERGTGEGRGAYLCPDPACAAAAVKRRAFDRAFRAACAKDSLEGLPDRLPSAPETI
jgi:uncharacterized protein